MTEMQLNGRKVIDASVDGIDVNDYPDFSDAYFDEAFYEDDGTPLTEEELEQLSSLYGEVVNEMAFDRCT